MMRKKYSHLLSPLRIGNTLFRNRLFAAATGLHALQGGEPYPTQAIIDTFANRARGGAAMVMLHAGIISHPYFSDGLHIAYDLYSAYTQHYLAQLVDAVHFYGAKASMEIMGDNTAPGYDVCAGMIGIDGKPSKEMTEDIMGEVAENYASHAYVMKEIGCDMVMVHMGYRMTIGARFLSPATNKRTDIYGGSVANRARFPIMIFDRIRQRCGKDFLIELRMSGTEPGPDGITIEYSIELAKLLEGHIDLLQVHSGATDAGSVMAVSFHPPAPNLAAAEAIKRSGTRLHIATAGSYQDPDEAEDIIAAGKADVISIARGWIADPDLGIKAYKGRGEDVVPCIKCNRCHDSACLEHRTCVCSVNPAIGIEHRLGKIVKPPVEKRKIGVVGGGPAGMQAALIAAARGHKVTLYEKDSVLGGQLNFSDYVSFKYALCKFKKYLIHQVEKSGVEVCLNTKADVALLKKANFDVVIAALGAEPIVPDIPGVKELNVVMTPAVYGNEGMLTSRLVVVGGGEVGCETALHLAMCGHEVTLIEMQKELAPDASPVYREALLKQIEASQHLEYILGARCTGIGDEVVYTNDEGGAQKLMAGSVIIAAGMQPRSLEAMDLCNTGDRFFVVGDCTCPGNVQKAMRTAFATAITL